MPDETTRSAIARLEAENAALRERERDWFVAVKDWSKNHPISLAMATLLNTAPDADPPAPFTLIAVDDLAAADLCDAAAARLRTGRPGNDAVETVARWMRVDKGNAMIQEPWAVSPKDAAELLGLNRRTFYRQIMPHVYSGTIKSAKIGRNRRIDVASLRAWYAEQMHYNDATVANH